MSQAGRFKNIYQNPWCFASLPICVYTVCVGMRSFRPIYEIRLLSNLGIGVLAPKKMRRGVDVKDGPRNRNGGIVRPGKAQK